MRFGEYLNETAILASTSMKKYALDVVNAIIKDLESHVTFSYFKKNLDQKEIKKVEIEYKDKKFSFSVIYDLSGNFESDAYVGSDGNVYIQFDKTKYDNAKDNIKQFENELYKDLIHEFTHIVDPKFNPEVSKKLNIKRQVSQNNKIVDVLFKRYTETKDENEKKEIKKELYTYTSKYLKFPWELDAFISSEAEQVAKELIENGRIKTQTLRKLTTFLPKNKLQKFYSLDDKIWRRFILHIHKIIENHYATI